MTAAEIDALLDQLSRQNNRDALSLADSYAFGYARLQYPPAGQTLDERRFLFDALGTIYLALLTKRKAVADACAPWFTVPQ